MKHKFSDRIDWSFRYTPAAQTNVAKTIARVRRELAESAKPANVTQLKREKRA